MGKSWLQNPPWPRWAQLRAAQGARRRRSRRSATPTTSNAARRSKSAQPFGLRRQAAVSSVAPPRRIAVDTPLSSLLGSGGLAHATRLTRGFGASSKVYFVGAGPGDPKLITRKGEELLSKSDCVIYDRLVDPALLRLTTAKCERIYVGKKSDEGGVAQTRINRLLAEKAKSHRIVVRLKGGDPTVFGRISEEIEELLKGKIPFEIVPGVSSAWAAAALAGIPLTDRRSSSSVAVVTGQEAAGKKRKVNWGTLGQAVDTLVILMGKSALPSIARKLIASGRSGKTPVALIRWAATQRQEVLVSTLGEVAHDLEARPYFTPPVVAVIGEVVRLRKKFVSSPLQGKRILVTRPAGDQAGLSKKLEEQGAHCVYLPTIGIYPRAFDLKETKILMEKLPQYDWILFTSHRGVDALDRLAKRLKVRLDRLIRAKICAIGPRTGEAVQAAGLRADIFPKEFSTEGIQEALRKISLGGKKILIPRSNLGMRDSLAQFLRRRGAQVEEVVMYETKPIRHPAQKVKAALRNLDAATFTSASTVRGFLENLKGARHLLRGAKVVAIGPETARELKASGIRKVYLPKNGWTVEGLLEAVQEAVTS